ncbi:MAG: hypothetical protein RIE08_06380 [Acidimicrobiales bacterium]
MKRLLVAIAAVGLLASAFAFFASPASANPTSVTFDANLGDVTVTVTPLNNCDPPDDEGQVDSPAGLSFNVLTIDEETLGLSDECNYTATVSHPGCETQARIDPSPANDANDNIANVPDLYAPGEAASFTIGDEAGFDMMFGEEANIFVTGTCASTAEHDLYKNVPIADADVFSLTTFTFLVTPSETYPATCTQASLEITGDGSPAVVLEDIEVAASVLVSNDVQSCAYDITEIPVDGWTNQIPLFGNTQFEQTPGTITPFRNVFDPVSINVTKSMDLDDFVVLSNIDTGLLNERIDFFISASDGCADTIINVFNGVLGSTGTFVNTSPAQVELAGFNDNVFTGEDVPVVVDGEPCTYVVEELADADLLEYCAPVNGDTQSLTWAPGLTSLDFTFHNDCEAPAEPEPTTPPTDGSPTPTPDVDDGGAGGPGGPSFAG